MVWLILFVWSVVVCAGAVALYVSDHNAAWAFLAVISAFMALFNLANMEKRP